MDEIVEFKKQIAGLYSLMKNDCYERIDNLLLAQLNDVAYRAIRKAGIQKKLDERAIKNEDMFKKLDVQLEQASAKIDFDKIEVDFEGITSTVGVCPVSQ